MLSATLIEVRKITDKRHGYRGGVSLIDLGNGSEKARINSRLIVVGPSRWVQGPFQVPELFGDSWGARLGENNVCFGTDCVAKVVLQEVSKILRAAGALFVQ